MKTTRKTDCKKAAQSLIVQAVERFFSSPSSTDFLLKEGYTEEEIDTIIEMMRKARIK